MKFTEYLLENTKEIYEGYLNHPFIKGLESGNLDIQKFRKYIIEDNLYLKEYTKVFALGILKCEDMNTMRYFYKNMSVIMADETFMHIKFIEYFNLTQEQIDKMSPQKANKEYIDYMMRVAKDGGVIETLMAVFPCMISYSFIGRTLYKRAKDNLENNFYKDWIIEYASDEFKQNCDELADYIDDCAKNMDDDKKARLLDIFKNSSLHEMKFWDMSFEMESEKCI